MSRPVIGAKAQPETPVVRHNRNTLGSFIRRIAPTSIGSALIVAGAYMESSAVAIVFAVLWVLYVAATALSLAITRSAEVRPSAKDADVRESSAEAAQKMQRGLWIAPIAESLLSAYVVWKIGFSTGVVIALVGLAIVTLVGMKTQLEMIARARRQAITGQVEPI